MKVLIILSSLLKQMSVLNYKLSLRLMNTARSWKKRKSKANKDFEKAWENWLKDETTKDFWS